MADAPVLMLRVRGRACALPLPSVDEVFRPLPTTPVAGAPPFLLGLARVRGAATPVVDLARLLDGAPGPIRRYVSVRVGARRAVLAVEDVLDVRRLDRAAGELPPLLRGAAQDLVASLATLDEELLVVLRDGLSLPEETWASSARA